MDGWRNQHEADERRRRQLWGPADHKLSWTEMCKIESEANRHWAKQIGGGAPLFMSHQIHKLKLERNRWEWEHLHGGKDLFHMLRPEDAIHIPQLRLDCNSGKITEWNRSLCDLTGISPEQVVGKLYAEVLDEFLPNLTKEYKEAAVEWVKKTNEEIDETAECDESCREDYLFPLPLPIKYSDSLPSKYVSGNRHYYEYVEILVARSDHLLDLYPQLTSYPQIPQCEMGAGTGLYEWNFDTSGWVGGLEFTLRRKEYIPSLQTLCRELLPKGDHTFDADGSLAVTKPASDKAEEKSKGKPQTSEEKAYTAISNYIRTCGPLGIQYIREVMNAVFKKNRNFGLRTKHFHFSADWSTNPETSTIHKSVVLALGGPELIKEKVDKGKLEWTLDFESGGDDSSPWNNGSEGMNKKLLQSQKRNQAWKVDRLWNEFKDLMTPVIAENKSFPITCGASDSTFILPAVNRPDRTVLTLKIEGHERSDGSYAEEKFKAHAVVQVPASLNLFQLHRVVCLTMNCGNHGRRETHEWRVPNINNREGEKPITGDDVEYVQIGETYFVENGKREDYGWPDKGLLDTGGAVRQRVSRTGAFIDQEMPFYSSTLDYDDMIRMRRKNFGCHFEKMKACIHSTCISAVFFQPGTTALLQDGLVKYFTSYKITCTKSEEYAGPLPLSPDINVMQPKCLRGKPEEDDSHWSVEKANKHLHLDRGCLRRNLRKVGSNDFLVQMPFCKSDPVIGRRRDYPVAVQLTGLDDHPMFLYGEPPLPSSEEYTDYVSSLRGRIDPKFLQENIMEMCGYFAVPFKYGSAGGAAVDHYACYDSDDKDSNGPSHMNDIGHVWAREVDEEMKRIDSLKPKKAAKGKKRKAPSKGKASAS
mmetsp:Transcript_4969/g.8146  ORF Transcript_4969/g.8146 Transcript_4969/m.8146 type:complete len:870 (+) Transcript_4969:176-2785(+)